MDVLSKGGLTDETHGNLFSLSKRHGLRIAPEHYAAWIRSHCKAFFSIDEWSAFMLQKDLSIGSRFHGNLIALLNGVPAILFAHDSRTAEMAKFMSIPHYPVHQVDRLDVRTLYEQSDFQRFAKAYAENYAQYKGFLERNGVRNNLA
jgi:polysaccharide pyruvyl transferase WcaK-like protein